MTAYDDMPTAELVNQAIAASVFSVRGGTPLDPDPSGQGRTFRSGPVTLTIPEPDFTVEGGLVSIEGDDAWESSNAEAAMVWVGRQQVPVAELERHALALLWLCLNHHHGEGLASEQ